MDDLPFLIRHHSREKHRTALVVSTNEHSAEIIFLVSGGVRSGNIPIQDVSASTVITGDVMESIDRFLDICARTGTTQRAYNLLLTAQENAMTTRIATVTRKKPATKSARKGTKRTLDTSGKALTAAEKKTAEKKAVVKKTAAKKTAPKKTVTPKIKGKGAGYKGHRIGCQKERAHEVYDDLTGKGKDKGDVIKGMVKEANILENTARSWSCEFAKQV